MTQQEEAAAIATSALLGQYLARIPDEEYGERARSLSFLVAKEVSRLTHRPCVVRRHTTDSYVGGTHYLPDHYVVCPDVESMYWVEGPVVEGP